MNPNTWEFLGSFVTCLQSITVANGYHTDAGLYVTREPQQIPDGQGTVLAVVLEGLQRPADAAAQRHYYQVSVVVVGKVSVGLADAQVRLHQLIDDVERAMSQRHAQFAPGLQSPRFVDARVIPPVEGVAWIGAEVRFSAHVLKR